jgi:tRNA-dihydrouridine synthase B
MNPRTPLSILTPMLFKNNCLIAAPMAGISDTVFRTLCKEMGADIVVTEMVSVDGIAYGADATMELLRFEPFERPVGVQLFGSNPEQFKKSAAITVERFHPDFIDLNAGCPVQKVVKKNGGASLLKDLDCFAKIVTALVEAVSLPVTVKLRSGWFKNQWVDCEFALCAESCGDNTPSPFANHGIFRPLFLGTDSRGQIVGSDPGHR